MREQILRRLQVKIDGRPGGKARAINKQGRRVWTTGRRSWAVEHALTWRALGYERVEIAFATSRKARPEFREFPVTQEEAIECVRELAQGPRGSKWRRIESTTEEESDV